MRCADLNWLLELAVLCCFGVVLFVWFVVLDCACFVVGLLWCYVVNSVVVYVCLHFALGFGVVVLLRCLCFCECLCLLVLFWF